MNDAKKFKKFKKAPFLVSLGLLTLAVCMFFLVSRGIERNKALAEEASIAWQNEEARRYELQSLDILLRDIAEERQKIYSYFATTKNIVPFLDSIEMLARRAGAKPEVVAVDASQDGKELTITVRAEGNFEAVYKFLELLENSPYELDFLTVDISRSAEGESAGWDGFFSIKLLSFIP